jgi:hypothetical protein
VRVWESVGKFVGVWVCGCGCEVSYQISVKRNSMQSMQPSNTKELSPNNNVIANDSGECLMVLLEAEQQDRAHVFVRGFCLFFLFCFLQLYTAALSSVLSYSPTL